MDTLKSAGSHCWKIVFSCFCKHPSWKASYVVSLCEVKKFPLFLVTFPFSCPDLKKKKKIILFPHLFLLGFIIPIRGQEGLGFLSEKKSWLCFSLILPTHTQNVFQHLHAMAQVTDGLLYSTDNTILWYSQHSRTYPCHVSVKVF